MKNSVKTKQIKVKSKRLTRADKKNAKLAEKAAEQLELCCEAGEFHKAYLAVELGIEQAKYEMIQARLAELQAPVTVTEEVVEAFEEASAFDNE